MEATEDPGYLRDLITAVESFGQAFDLFVALHEEVDDLDGLIPSVNVRDGVTPDILRRVSSEVSRTAGGVMAAAELVGSKTVLSRNMEEVDPIADWLKITEAGSNLRPSIVFDACDQTIGRLGAMARRAEANKPPELGVRALHPLIWGAAGSTWRSGHYREAVSNAAQALVDHVKTLTNRRDVADTSIWQQAFSASAPEAGKPRLRWPGDPSDATVRSMQDGLRQFAPGAQMTVRNSAAHGTEQMPEQEALERLAVLSLLARWVDQCEAVSTS